MVEMHLLSVNADFHYDPIYALGVVTSFERFIEGYRPELDKASIFTALCQSVRENPDQYRQDAYNVLEQAKSLSISDLMDKMKQAASGQFNEGILFDTLQKIAQNSRFKYSRLFAIGLYTVLMEVNSDLVKNQEQRNQTFQEVSDVLSLTSDKLQKDIDLYRSNLDKMQQILTVIEETIEADRKKRQSQIAKETLTNTQEGTTTGQ
ncbi:inositol monophosphatase [Aphanothece sacrum FPU1]|uniref:Protein Thf1 n=2 Tax=Aphanothece sacrum TaxID=1122 RepID=A0A401IH88_APHSA|nr:inositol monophosphatase [Aphanothece sacrum FPU1]GBF84011.1 inositol monophosphatase [Aphanothece sacrum FPU3]